MKNLITFESCCKYLGIPTDLPKCYVRERQHQSAYKLSVCMAAWNKIDGFEPDEKASYHQEGVGYTPYFLLRDGNLLSSGGAYYGSVAGIVLAYASACGCEYVCVLRPPSLLYNTKSCHRIRRSFYRNF